MPTCGTVSSSKSLGSSDLLAIKLFQAGSVIEAEREKNKYFEEYYRVVSHGVQQALVCPMPA